VKLKKVIRYFFPAVDRRWSLPLLPRAYVDMNPQRRADLDHRAEILKMAAVARTDAAAKKLLELHPGKPIRAIIRAERRQRRPRRWWLTFWRQFVKMW
jgi:hypothetical protein